MLSALHVCHAQKGKHGHFGVGITRFKEGESVLRGGGDKISLCPLYVCSGDMNLLGILGYSDMLTHRQPSHTW